MQMKMYHWKKYATLYYMTCRVYGWSINEHATSSVMPFSDLVNLF